MGASYQCGASIFGLYHLDFGMEEYRLIGYVRSMDEAQKYIAGRNCLYGEQELAREFNLGMQVEVWVSGDKFVAFDTQWRRLAEYFGTQK